MSLPSVAIVILNWNGRSFLEKFLPAVGKTTYPSVSIVVADNASTDDSITFLQAHYPAIRILSFTENLGFAAGYNAALQQVQADYYMLLNSDVEVEPGWLEPMVALLESDMSIAACQPKLLAYTDRRQFEYAGGAGGWIDRYGYPFSRGRIFDICEQDNGQYDSTEPVFWASGAALFIRSRCFHQVQGFDGYFFAHMEEIDLCWRLQLEGYKIYACPESVVYHVGGGTLSRGNPRKTFLNFRNNHIMLAKNLPKNQLLYKTPYRLLLDGVTAIKGLMRGDGQYFLAIIRAHLGFYQWLLFHRKKSPFPSTRKGKLTGVLPKNIVWLHFVQKKNTFSQITGKTN